MTSNHFVYILKCKDGSLYTGYTNNLERRLKMHLSCKGAKFTRGRGPFTMVYSKQFATKKEAMKFEYKIKRLKRKEKEMMVNSYQEG
ncbi:GIY-YIG nuclease family protein [Aquibacillus rhizosphaerae]|uniref:GIY-YIG nuclease family protein n=1 Tax=Aquibacillus rhizosphaerae TaxID=3051431 RepID=A0ABT7KZV0_9BACI|nr:GIY-YIG nuclease family protein [Aquibacillus sp. LR5S19]MDL4839081.1 GIY-YIG nuclease family protein [Aquibacillus sp. LR5S19]